MTSPINQPPPPIQDYLISQSQSAFPGNIAVLAEARLNALDLGINILRRMPTNDDKNYSVGIVPILRNPNPESVEIRGPNSFVGATLNQYLIAFFAFVKNADRELATATHSLFAELVEHILVDDAAFRAGLGALDATVMGTRKRMGRHWIQSTRYLSNEVDGNHFYMSVTEAIFETEKVA